MMRQSLVGVPSKMRTKGLPRRAVVFQWIECRLSPGTYCRTVLALTVRSGALDAGDPSRFARRALPR